MEKLDGILLVLGQKRDLEEIFSSEMVPIPSAIFYEYGDLRKSSKSVLLNKLAEWKTEVENPDVELIDGIGILYSVIWPKAATVGKFTENFARGIQGEHEIYVIFGT